MLFCLRRINKINKITDMVLCVLGANKAKLFLFQPYYKILGIKCSGSAHT